jgi:hypothetical protein
MSQVIPESKQEPMEEDAPLEHWPPVAFRGDQPLQIPFGPATAAKWKQLADEVSEIKWLLLLKQSIICGDVCV